MPIETVRSRAIKKMKATASTTKLTYRSLLPWRCWGSAYSHWDGGSGVYKQPTVLTSVGLSFLTTRTNKHTYSEIKPTRKKKWTLDALRLEALKYDTRLAFQKGSKSAYRQAQKHGRLDSICRHMPKPLRLYTDSELIEDAKQYRTKKEYRTNSVCYKKASKRGLLESIYQQLNLR